MNDGVRELRQRAIRLLARREHTCAELRRKLAPHGTEDDIQTVIADLQTNNLQSDARFAESWLRARAARLGAARLRQTLQQKGVASELVTESIAQAGLGDEHERAHAIWTRKFGTPPQDRSDWARQARFLQSRGFASETIRRVVPAITQTTYHAFSDAVDDE